MAHQETLPMDDTSAPRPSIKGCPVHNLGYPEKERRCTCEAYMHAYLRERDCLEALEALAMVVEDCLEPSYAEPELGRARAAIAKARS